MTALTQTRSVVSLVGSVLPQGAHPPPDLPPEIFRAALETFTARRRLDMRALALELGIGRATLYRRVGARDRLLGEVIWYLTRRLILRALNGAERLHGVELVLTVIERFMRDVQASPDVRRFLESEPEAALRILTSKDGPVQQGMIDTVDRVLAAAEKRDGFRPYLDQETLAYTIVRIGESFLYADVIADAEPDVARAMKVIAQLVRED